MHAAAALACALVAPQSRPVRVRAFGKKLAELRGARSAEQVLIRARVLGIKLTASTLYQYEGGTVEAPDPGVLWALSKVYGVDLNDLIALLVANRNDPHLEELPPIAEGHVVLTDPADRTLFEALQGVPTATRNEMLDFLAFRSLDELPPDERVEFLRTIRRSVQLARRARAKQSGERTHAATQETGKKNSRKRAAG